MDYYKIITIAQVAIAVLLTVVVLLQNRGAGLSGVFGGSGGGVYRTKRGIEKTLFTFTIILSVLFLGISFLHIII